MKIQKNSLRVWFALTSVTGFMGGWAVLAHSPKPAQASQADVSQSTAAELTPLPTLPPLAPLPSLSQQSQGQSQAQKLTIQPLPSIPQTGFRQPRFRTGGS